VIVTGQGFVGRREGHVVEERRPVSEEVQINSPLNSRGFPSRSFAARHDAVLTASALCRSAGYLSLPVNDLPAVDYPVIMVNAAYPGASLTRWRTTSPRAGKAVHEDPGLELVTSQSQTGYTKLTLQFALDKSIDAAATDVQTASPGLRQSADDLPSRRRLPRPIERSADHVHRPDDRPMTNGSVRPGQHAGRQRISIVSGVSQCRFSARRRRFASRQIVALATRD